MWASVRERIHTHSNMCAKGRLKNAWGNVWNTNEDAEEYCSTSEASFLYILNISMVSSLYRTSTAMAQHLLLKGTESRTGWEMQQLLWYQFGSIFHPLANILKIQRILKYKINQGKIQNGGQPYKAGPVAGQTFTFTDDLWWLPACLDSQALLPTTILNVAPL